MSKGILRRRCPLCGGKIVVSDLYQVSYDYTITHAGVISKKHTTSLPMSMDASVAACENAPDRCPMTWDTDSFAIDERGRFVDYK